MDDGGGFMTRELRRDDWVTSTSSLPRRTRVLAVTSGKGGVGKTNIAINLAYALIALGKEVLVLDADLGLANVDVLLGTAPRWHIGHALSGQVTVEQMIHQAPGGLLLVAGGSGMEGLADLSGERVAEFVAQARGLEGRADFIIIDTGAGVHQAVLTLLQAADEVLVVTTPEPAAITDAYALIKLLLRNTPAVACKLVLNQVESPGEGGEAIRRFAHTVHRFLGIDIEPLGSIPRDASVQRAVRSQRPFFLATPSAPAALAVARIARNLVGQSVPAPIRIPFFERLSHIASAWRH